jgi:cytidylate kinase
MREYIPVNGVVTISASYGAGGSLVGPGVAERLGLPFYDRAIPTQVAQRLDLPDDAAADLDERGPTGFERIAIALAHLSTPAGPTPVPQEGADDPERFCRMTESVLRELADSTGAVVLGRAAMVVLGSRPDVLCVRLDGPVEARIRRAVEYEGLDEASVRRQQKQIDGAREAYARVFYRVRQDDPRLYHVVLDSTALSIETCVEVIVQAARGRFGRASDEAGGQVGR